MAHYTERDLKQWFGVQSVLCVYLSIWLEMQAVELRQCVGLVELSLEHNKLVRPLLDFRSFYMQFNIFV